MSKLYSEYLKRENSLMSLIGNVLPNPDKVLGNNGNDIQIYKDLLIDPHLTATILQRKMQVLQMGWEVVSQMLDSILYGFNVSEIIWGTSIHSAKNSGTLSNPIQNIKRIIPKEIIAKPQEWFAFDNENELMLRYISQKAARHSATDSLKKLPKYKFILSRHQPTFSNPYGEKILSKCYWPVKLKQSSIESWNELIEKYGVPYLIGVVSDTATEAEKEAVIDDLLDMIENNVVTRGASQQIEIKEQASYDIGQMFEKMVEFQNKEISKAVLSVTLTIDSGTSGSYKASDVHRQMLEYIGISDKKIIEGSLNTMFDYYTELNYGKNSEKIRVKLSKKEAITDETAGRDKTLSEIGVKFTKGYFRKKYNLSDEDFELATVE